MKDIEINLKLILIMVFIIILGGTLLWVGYNLYVELLPKEEIKDFEGEWTSNVDNNNLIQNNHINADINTDFNLNDIIGEEDKFEINNKNAITPNDKWVKRTYNYSGVGYRAMYYIPDDWERSAIIDSKNGVRINANMLKLDNLTSETTYDEFLKQFIETKEKTEFSPEGIENYDKRIININGETFYVLKKDGYHNAVYEYFCLAKENYVYYLEMSTSKENYNEEVINNINEIYSTFRIY